MVAVQEGNKNLLNAISFAIFKTEDFALQILAALQYTVEDYPPASEKMKNVLSKVDQKELEAFYQLNVD